MKKKKHTLKKKEQKQKGDLIYAGEAHEFGRHEVRGEKTGSE